MRRGKQTEKKNGRKMKRIKWSVMQRKERKMKRKWLRDMNRKEDDEEEDEVGEKVRRRRST